MDTPRSLTRVKPVPDGDHGAVRRVLGVDGARFGWVAVALRIDLADGRLVAASFDGATGGERFEDVVARLPDAACIAVDMPLGLGEASPRACDEAGRRLLGRHQSRLFPMPPRAALVAEDHAEAVAISRRLTGRGVSRQAHALRAKVLELESVPEATAALLHEVHPELSFALMNDDRPVGASKKTWEGQARRRALLESRGIVLPADLGEAGRAAPDDVLDAAAAAWSAARIVAGAARTFGDGEAGDRAVIRA